MTTADATAAVSPPETAPAEGLSPGDVLDLQGAASLDVRLGEDPDWPALIGSADVIVRTHTAALVARVRVLEEREADVRALVELADAVVEMTSAGDPATALAANELASRLRRALGDA